MGDETITLAERDRLDLLIGRALINEELCHSLLFRESRREVLDAHTHHFSKATREFLLSLADQARLEDLAMEIYRGLFQGDSGRSH